MPFLCNTLWQPFVSYAPSPETEPIFLRNGLSSLGSTSLSPTLTKLTSALMTSCVSTSTARCRLRHVLRFSFPCFLTFHSPSPKTLRNGDMTNAAFRLVTIPYCRRGIKFHTKQSMTYVDCHEKKYRKFGGVIHR